MKIKNPVDFVIIVLEITCGIAIMMYGFYNDDISIKLNSIILGNIFLMLGFSLGNARLIRKENIGAQ